MMHRPQFVVVPLALVPEVCSHLAHWKKKTTKRNISVDTNSSDSFFGQHYPASDSKVKTRNNHVHRIRREITFLIKVISSQVFTMSETENRTAPLSPEGLDDDGAEKNEESRENQRQDGHHLSP